MRSLSKILVLGMVLGGIWVGNGFSQGTALVTQKQVTSSARIDSYSPSGDVTLKIGTLKIGDTVRVKASTGTNVRKHPGGSEITDIDYIVNNGCAPQGARGRILAGPEKAKYEGKLYTWWKVEFISWKTNTRDEGGDRKYTGWSIENNLEKANSASAKIESYYVTPKLAVGEKLTLKLTVKNTGNITYAFIYGGSLWGPPEYRKIS